MGTPREKQPSAKIQWHPAFCAAAELELRSNKGDLEFKREYNLSKKPLQMDLLIIEKRKGVQIQNEIGKIFRGHNIIEYKSPDDGMTIDDFFKTLGYAFLYKGLGEKVNQIPLRELTISLFRASIPKELLSQLSKKTKQLTIANKDGNAALQCRIFPSPMAAFLFTFFYSAFTLATTFSTVNPKYGNSLLYGADAPKRFIPIISPSRPT